MPGNTTKKPAYVFINFAAGGIHAGIPQGLFAKELERRTGLPLADFCHAVSVASAGEMTGIPLFAPAKDDPRKPRYSAEESEKMFETYAQQWLPKVLRYGQQHISKKKHELTSAFCLAADNLKKNLQSYFTRDHVSDVVQRTAGKVKYHLNNDIVADTLEKILGDVKLKDMLRTTYISAHDYTAESAAKTAVLFSKEIYPDGHVVYSHDEDMPIIEPMQGSMAVPGHYRSKHIEGVGHFSDMGHVHHGLEALIKFKATLPPEASIIYIELGPVRFHNLMTPDKHDLCSAFDIISSNYLMGCSSNQSYSQAVQIIPHLLNGGELFDLTPSFSRKDYTEETLPFSQNFLDASSANLNRIRQAVENCPEIQEKLTHLSEVLLANHQAWNRPEPVTYTPQPQKATERRRWFAGLFGSHPPRHSVPQPMAA